MIQRRQFLKRAAAGSLVGEFASAAPASRPNILFLIADDLTFRAVHSLTNPEVETPNIDRMIRRGCTFTHAFHGGSWSGAVCIASRTQLNTGLTAFRAHRRSEQTPLWCETMGNAGYDTHIVGKWHLSESNLERSFKTKGPVSPGMFESGPAAYNRPAPGNTWTPWDKSLKGQWLHTATWKNAKHDEIRHSAEIWADCASDFLSGRKQQANPFLLYVGFNSPHDPRQAPKEYVDRYPAPRIAIPPNYMPEHPFDQGDHRIRDEVLAPFPRTHAAVRLHRSEYYAHVTYMDTQIGRILDALERSPHAASTYVVLTADHGLAVGEHGLMGKQNMYEHSIRIPLVFNGPNIPGGRVVDQMVYQHSVFPTACELAGVRLPATVEFPSLVDLLHGKNEQKHDAMFCWYLRYQRAVRTRDHKLIVYPQIGKIQLFDVKNDPWETHDLAGRPEHASLQKDLLARLHRFQREWEDDLPPV